MKKITELKLGFSDAENYKRKENKELFNAIFVKNVFLEQLMSPSSFFLIGEKGTGKTAYAVYLSNSVYQGNKSELKYIRETDYQKFVNLKQKHHLLLSDYESIWKVIILLLLAKSINVEELEGNPFSKNKKFKIILEAIDEYYNHAFSPEILAALNLIENSKIAAELVSKHLKAGGEQTAQTSFQESRFQVNLLYLQREFERALSDIKTKTHHILFIDGIDIRPGSIPYDEYLECIKGLGNAIWNLNNDFFSQLKYSNGRFRAVLLIRPDIFNSIGLQNSTNKILDNSVFLDWKTTYPDYRHSQIFGLIDRLLNAQQGKKFEHGEAWDFYFPWKSPTTSPSRGHDPSFYKLLRLSYSRPRDLVTILKILQQVAIEDKTQENTFFSLENFDSDKFQNRYSEYLMGGIKDQLSFYYTDKDYEFFLKFFNHFEGKGRFDYNEYLSAYKKFTEDILNYHTGIPEFVDNPDKFLQFLYDTNILCYIENSRSSNPSFSWCYRDRSPANISPKVKSNVRYEIHYGLLKSLNLGFGSKKRKKYEKG
ncbi:MAG: funZ protein [Candidatus Omnitrophota bacterium]